MNISKHTHCLAVILAALLPALTGLAQSGPPVPPILFFDFYSFSGTNFESELDYPALNYTNVFSVPEVWGNALMLDTSNLEPAFLRYRVVETNGFVNMDMAAGALFAIVVPDWASANTLEHGHGPGEPGYLLAAGDFSSGSPRGLWALYVDAGGTNLYFGGVSNSVATTYLTAPISWASNSLHEIGLAYTTNSMLYLDGQFAASGGPVRIVPATSTWTNGFCVGSDNAGYEQFRGEFLWLEFDTTNMVTDITSNYFMDEWAYDTNSYYTWLNPTGGGFHPDGGGGFHLPPTPTNTFNTNFAAYTNFWLLSSNAGGEAQVSLINPCRGLTYVILTNAMLESLTSSNWQTWVTLVGSNTVMPAPALKEESNALYFCAELIFSTGTNGLPDWWCMQYFGTLSVNPYADPDGDGLCNLSEYLLGSNPTNAHSMSSTKTDAQYWFLAYTNDASTRLRLFQSNSPGTDTVTLTLSNTLAGTNYQIYSKDMTVTNSAWRVETNFLGTNAATQITISLAGRTLGFIGGDGEDPDGDGLPSGYEVLATLTDPLLPDTGLTGTPDGYKDPDGDGYVNLEEYYNGTDPHVFNTPAGPQNVVEDFNSGGNTETICWQAAQGPVLAYVIYDGDGNPIATNLPTQLKLTIANQNSSWFGVEAIYSNGTSGTIYGDFYTQHPGMAQAAVAHGPGGNVYLLTSAANSNAIGYNLNLGWWPNQYPENAAYYQDWRLDSPASPPSNWVPASQFTNGVAVLTAAQTPLYAVIGAVSCGLTPQVPGNASWATTDTQNQGFQWFWTDPFMDGTAVMKQNVRFLLRAANAQPFGYQLNPQDPNYPGEWYSLTDAQDHVCSSYYYGVGGASLQGDEPWPFIYRSLDHFAPFEDNYFYCNFVFNSSLINSQGYLDTGFWPWNVFDMYYQSNVLQFSFPTYNYVSTNSQASIPGLLSASQTPYVGYFQGDPGDFGAYTSGNSLAMSSGAVNIFGLPYSSLELTLRTNGAVEFATLSPGHNVTGYGGLPFYAGTAEPNLQTVGYYFANVLKDPLPEDQDGSFAVTNTTPPIYGSVGASMIVAGFAKQAVLNGYNNVFAYLGQYFTNAFVMSNGVITTNPAGIVSEYGEFFPTVPGHVALLTKPDPDQTNIQGVCQLDIIRLSLDVNHDGTMDETFTGPDNTSTTANGSPQVPYVFWANNDYDRWDVDLIDSATTGGPFYQEDSVASNSIYALSPYTGDYVADCDYQDSSGNRAIPCPRDLEDFARLWVSGVSNTLSRLPSGSTVTLNWGDVGNPDWNANNPTIDIFQAADADGGMGYLTNLATASNQINNTLCQYVGRLGPGSNITLNASTFSNNWAGDHYIFCGVGYGSGTLYLTVADGSGNTLAQSSQSIQIEDIKQMYERWTVGDTPGVAPQNIAVPAQDDFPPGITQAFSYPYDPAYDTNDTYILSVHGYNIPFWEAERFSERAFKRLYWQGYTGRFGSFRWPAHSNPLLFDDDEFASWESGTGLYHLLYSLNAKYPGKVYLFAHSQGNVAAGQALLMAGTNTLVNTYIAAQAAVAVHTYDPTTTNRTPTPGTSFTTPDRYAQYWTNGAPPYFNGVAGAGRYINFFNTNDWALTIPWPVNQDTKPDQTWKTFSLWQSYDYNGTNFQSVVGFWPSYQNLLFPTNTFTIYAYCDQAPCRALGAQPNVGLTFGVFNSRSQIELDNPPYNFTQLHIYHSGEFRSDNMQRWQFWNQVLLSYGLK